MKKIIMILVALCVIGKGVSIHAESDIQLKKLTDTKKHKQISEKKLEKERKEAERRFKRELGSLLDAIVEKIPSKGKMTMVAIPNFDRYENDRYQKNFNFTFQKMLNLRLRGKKKYKVMERDSIDDILDTIGLDEKGFYNSKKEAALGKLVGADFIIIGQLKTSKDEQKEFITIKLIDVQKERTLLEKKAEFERSMLYENSSNFLIQQGSYDYLPPYLRFVGGIEYYQHITTTHFKDKVGDLGFNLGIVFDLNKTHSFQVLTNVIFNLAGMYEYDNRIIENDLSQGGTDSNVISAIDFTYCIEYQMGYGYIFKPFKMIYFRPSLFLGYSYAQYDYKHLYLSDDISGIGQNVVYPSNGSLIQTGSTTSYYINSTLDFLINYNSRFSYYLSFGYKFMFNIFQDTWSAAGQGGTYDAILSGVTMRGGVSFYL